MEALVLRVIIAIGVIWIVERVIETLKINEQAKAIINVIVLLVGVVFIVAPSALEAIR